MKAAAIAKTMSQTNIGNNRAKGDENRFVISYGQTCADGVKTCDNITIAVIF